MPNIQKKIKITSTMDIEKQSTKHTVTPAMTRKRKKKIRQESL